MAARGFLADLTMKIGADVADLKRGLRQATGGVKQFANKAKVAGKQFKSSMSSSMGSLGGVVNPQIAMFTGMLTQSFAAMKALTAGTKLFKLALAATGIGLIVIAIASLVAYLTTTEEGMEMVTKATEGLKAIMTRMTDILSSLGEMMIWAFQNPMEAIQILWDKITNLGGRVIENVIKGFGLLGAAIVKVFKGDFKGALEDAKDGFAAIYQVDIAKEAINSIGKAIMKNIVEPFKAGVAVGQQMIDNADEEIKRAIKLGKLERLRGLYRKEARELGVTPAEEVAAFEKELEVTRQIGALNAQAIDDKVVLLEKQHALGNNTKADNLEYAELLKQQGMIAGDNFRKEKEVLLMISTAKNKELAIQKKINDLRGKKFADAAKKDLDKRNALLDAEFDYYETHLADMFKLQKKAAEESAEAKEEAFNKNLSQAQSYNALLEQVMHKGIIESAKAVANAINGIGQGNMSFGKKILLLVSEFAIQFGTLLIAAAVAVEAFQKSLSSYPWLAALAGVALIIAGNLAKNSINNRSQGMANGGIASGGLTMVGERGRELVNLPLGSRVMTAPQTIDMMNGSGSRIMIADVRLKGEDIWLSFTEANRRLNNTG